MRISDWSSDVCSSDLGLKSWLSPISPSISARGTSGIGTTAIQLGRSFGLTVSVTCGSDEKCAAALDIGAAHAINYNSEDFVERVLEITGRRGVDIVLDMVGGAYLPRNVRCLAEDGRLSLARTGVG